MMATSFKPAGHSTVTPYMMVPDVAKQIEFLRKAFGAEPTEQVENKDGSVGHAEVRIFDCVVMMGGAREQWKARPSSFYVYVPDTDAAYKAAMAAGGKSIMEPADQFYGDRNAGVEDEFGNQWWLATHLEDLSEEELQKRAAKAGR